MVPFQPFNIKLYCKYTEICAKIKKSALNHWRELNVYLLLRAEVFQK